MGIDRFRRLGVLNHIIKEIIAARLGPYLSCAATANQDMSDLRTRTPTSWDARPTGISQTFCPRWHWQISWI